MRVEIGSTYGLLYSGTAGGRAVTREGFWALSLEAAWRGRRQALKYIAKCAKDGDALAAIERGGSPIAEIARRDSFVDVRI
jgi:hypothetical protein